MIPSDETDFNKQESSTSDNTKASSSSTTSWTRLKDPRIVRVSRALGGKDRHSKVCTVRGLRDRRVRLSVPTAIQLYDLQERLGLNQPSKVVDWLLNAAKHEIDELPPLQIPQGTFIHNLDPIIASHDFRLSQSGKHGLKTATGESIDWSDHMKHLAPGKSKEVSGETREEERQLSLENNNQGVFVSLNNLPFKQNPSSFPYTSPFVRWDPSNLTLSHIPPRSHGLITTQQELDWHNMNFPSGSHHQVLVSHQAQPSFPSQIVQTNTEFDPKQISFQGSQLSSSSLSPHVDSTTQLIRPIDFNMTVNLLPSRNNEGS